MTEQFIQERLYLKGVSQQTARWYRGSFRAFDGALETKQAIIGRIGELKARGTSHVSINSYMRCINAYFMWLHTEHGKELVRIPRLKEEQKVLQTLSSAQMSVLVGFRPQSGKFTVNLRRAHLIALTILDTGLRASEVLGLTKEDVDFENLILKVLGKGNKHRLIPFSVELRKSLFRHVRNGVTKFVFGTKNNTKVSVHNLDRDFKKLGKKLGMTGIRFSPHTFRHTFAATYLRNGGDLFALSRILGHSKLETTQIYLRSLGIEHLSANHRQFSPLSQMKRVI